MKLTSEKIFKPRMKKTSSGWLCGGFWKAPWYVDWYWGETMEQAYLMWKRSEYGT